MGVVCGGQVGIVGHLDIGDGVKLGAQSGVTNDIPPGETYAGYPAEPVAAWRRTAVHARHLPELVKRVRQLEKDIEKLKEGK
jgi:UDP-3-O-[3-hydroxymyristoyl] glucosamine N-acyltransferase